MSEAGDELQKMIDAKDGEIFGNPVKTLSLLDILKLEDEKKALESEIAMLEQVPWDNSIRLRRDDLMARLNEINALEKEQTIKETGNHNDKGY